MSQYNSKSMSKTSESKTHFSHNPTRCLRRNCSMHTVSTAVGYLAHYRNGCQKNIPDCDKYTGDTVVDGGVWRFRGELARRVRTTLAKIGMVGPRREQEDEEE